MVKNILLVFSFLFILNLADAQDKKYILVEHFTNTRCPICASRNPQLFNTVERYEDDVHHISFHPPYPYSSCFFYNHNKTENLGRAEYYNVQGSPTAVVDGLEINGNPLLPESEITARLNQTASISILASETSGMTRSVSIQLNNLLDIDLTGSYRLFVAVVEKEIQYAAPNGENLHHNVFRRYLTGLEGLEVNNVPAGSSISETFTYDIDGEWNADQIYVIAYLQDTNSKTVLNSGSTLDRMISSTRQNVDDQWSIKPNPAAGVVTVTLPSDAVRIRIYSITGQILYTDSVIPNADQHYIDVSHLPNGTYFLRVEGHQGVYTRKLLKI